MSDKDTKKFVDEETKITIDDLKEPLLLFGNEQSKKLNQVGKASFKKEKNSNKNCLKLIHYTFQYLYVSKSVRLLMNC